MTRYMTGMNTERPGKRPIEYNWSIYPNRLTINVRRKRIPNAEKTGPGRSAGNGNVKKISAIMESRAKITIIAIFAKIKPIILINVPFPVPAEKYLRATRTRSNTRIPKNPETIIHGIDRSFLFFIHQSPVPMVFPVSYDTFS
jgi:hypothetical protein